MLENMAQVKELQKNHGEWNDSMKAVSVTHLLTYVCHFWECLPLQRSQILSKEEIFHSYCNIQTPTLNVSLSFVYIKSKTLLPVCFKFPLVVKVLKVTIFTNNLLIIKLFNLKSD